MRDPKLAHILVEILSLPAQNYNFLSLWYRWKDRDRF